MHGQERKHHHPIFGINGRMDTIQAAILLEILEVFPDEVAKASESWPNLFGKFISS